MMRSNSIRNILYGHIAALAAVCPFVSCSTDTTYHHYEAVRAEGWGKLDTFYFKVDTIVRPGRYTTALCLRTNADYPYRRISARVMQEIKPRHTANARTVSVEIICENGIHDGDGITYYTHEAPVDTLELRPGDSLFVKVAHYMRRETMPGITDVGIKVERK